MIIFQTLRGDFGLFVRWDGDSAAKIRIDPQYFNKTCGLCGTFDRDPTNDLQTREGFLVSQKEIEDRIMPPINDMLNVMFNTQ